VSLPAEFDKQLSGVQIGQAMRSINAAMSHVDAAIIHCHVVLWRSRTTNYREQNIAGYRD
jgi:hypothetical protein